jgi:hypothetical protein
MGDISKMGWQIELVKYAIWANPCISHLLLLSILKTLVSSQVTI